jgi:hypothetical protein
VLLMQVKWLVSQLYCLIKLFVCPLILCESACGWIQFRRVIELKCAKCTLGCSIYEVMLKTKKESLDICILLFYQHPFSIIFSKRFLNCDADLILLLFIMNALTPSKLFYVNSCSVFSPELWLRKPWEIQNL